MALPLVDGAGAIKLPFANPDSRSEGGVDETC